VARRNAILTRLYSGSRTPHSNRFPDWNQYHPYGRGSNRPGQCVAENPIGGACVAESRVAVAATLVR